MSGGKDKIHEHPNAGSNGFDKNPENINRNGRPRQSFSTINTQLKDKGIEPISKNQLTKAYQLIFNATETELEELLSDAQTPFAFKLIIRELMDSKTRSKALFDLRNYVFGKAPEKQVQGKTKIKVSFAKSEDGKPYVKSERTTE